MNPASNFQNGINPKLAEFKKLTRSGQFFCGKTEKLYFTCRIEVKFIYEQEGKKFPREGDEFDKIKKDRKIRRKFPISIAEDFKNDKVEFYDYGYDYVLIDDQHKQVYSLTEEK